jgi:hypothetical protein
MDQVARARDGTHPDLRASSRPDRRDQSSSERRDCARLLAEVPARSVANWRRSLIAACAPGCVYKEYPTAGHGLYVSHAEQLNAYLLDFISN